MGVDSSLVRSLTAGVVDSSWVMTAQAAVEHSCFGLLYGLSAMCFNMFRRVSPISRPCVLSSLFVLATVSIVAPADVV